MIATHTAPAPAAAEVRRIADMIEIGRATPADIAEAGRLHGARGIATGSGVYRHHIHAKGQRRTPTVPLPGPDSGMGPVACELAAKAFGVAIGEPPYPVAEWAGPVPRLKPSDAFFAADQMSEEHPELGMRALLEAARQVGEHYRIK